MKYAILTLSVALIAVSVAWLTNIILTIISQPDDLIEDIMDDNL